MTNEPMNTPDHFDRLMGALHGLPDILQTKSSTVRAVTPMTGASELYIIQTYRQRDEGDTIFIECVRESGTVRMAIPPSVAMVIARQHDMLTGKSRSKAAKIKAQARKAKGLLPGFMKKKKGGG